MLFYNKQSLYSYLVCHSYAPICYKIFMYFNTSSTRAPAHAQRLCDCDDIDDDDDNDDAVAVQVWLQL